MLTKTALTFVSPGYVIMGRFLITWDDRNNHSRYLNTAICALPMKQADFGPEAVRVNSELIERAPKHESAWTRLGRCHLEQRNFDEAVSALRAALALNPTNGIATNLLAVSRQPRGREDLGRQGEAGESRGRFLSGALSSLARHIRRVIRRLTSRSDVICCRCTDRRRYIHRPWNRGAFHG